MTPPFRVGFGYDVHQLRPGLPLILGGVHVEHHVGALGHSDADVLIHVICDALLGAANLRDIGFHFPDTADEYKGVDSKILLKKVLEKVRAKSYEPGNLDCTICLQHPKINPYIPRMQQSIALVCGMDADLISIKATTTEKLGFVGRRQGVSAYCTALIYHTH